MIHKFIQLGVLTLGASFACSAGFAQGSSPSASAQAQSSSGTQTSAQAQSQPQNSSTPAPTDVKKTKKVWTNDDVGSLNGPVSVVGGNGKNPPGGKGGSDAKADGNYIKEVKKQLEKLQSDLDDTTKQLSDLKDFSGGKAPATGGGYSINKGYNRVPVDQQITNLEEKKKQLMGKIDALLDEARKKGVQPGDLRQ
jgi:hypothetical protein